MKEFYPFHPLAELFPLMEGAEFDALVDDICENGLREPIILHEGKILDGRNRYRACQLAEIKPLFEQWNGKGSIQAFVVSKNLHRRHLNESQRAMIAARLATLKIGHVASQRHGVGISTPSQRTAAELLNVSRDTVVKARIVQNEGSPEQIKAVEAGRAAVSSMARTIRNLPPKKKRKQTNGSSLAETGKNPERIQMQRINAEVWMRVRDSLVNLTSVPLPTDVAKMLRGIAKVSPIVDARLERANQWLTEFSNAWKSNG